MRADIEKTGLHAMRRIWDEGFREITSGTKPINTPEDLHGFKIRVPPSPISLSIFKDLGAAPGTLNIAELYTALQTKVFDGQENPLANIETQKFYQVQKYCSLTDHMWVGYWILVNGAFWNSMPAELQKAVADGFDGQAPAQRTASAALNNSLRATLEGRGAHLQHAGQGAVPRGARRLGLLQGVARQVRPHAVVGAGAVHRPARLTRG